MRYDRLNPNVQKSKGDGNARHAPQKPLLLLCLFDMAENSLIESPQLNKSAELRLRFESYWRVCQPRWGGQPGLDLPFHHLSTQGFWEPRTKSNHLSESPHSTDHAILTDDFLQDLHNKEERKKIRYQLITTWFPENEQAALLVALGFSKAEMKKLEFTLSQSDDDLQPTGRDARFRVTVVTQYRFTCALTGYGSHTAKGYSIVEAAHIHAFSKSRNNNPTNGLSLTRDSHWMFDRGLWTIDEKLRVIVAEEVFTEWGDEARQLKSFDQHPLRFAEGVQLRPAEKHLAWHRKNVFAK